MEIPVHNIQARCTAVIEESILLYRHHNGFHFHRSIACDLRSQFNRKLVLLYCFLYFDYWSVTPAGTLLIIIHVMCRVAWTNWLIQWVLIHQMQWTNHGPLNHVQGTIKYWSNKCLVILQETRQYCHTFSFMAYVGRWISLRVPKLAILKLTKKFGQFRVTLHGSHTAVQLAFVTGLYK